MQKYIYICVYMYQCIFLLIHIAGTYICIYICVYIHMYERNKMFINIHVFQHNTMFARASCMYKYEQQQI